MDNNTQTRGTSSVCDDIDEAELGLLQRSDVQQVIFVLAMAPLPSTFNGPVPASVQIFSVPQSLNGIQIYPNSSRCL